jgi:asparagine synthase (glutamine-hydrolysing)
MQARGPDAYGEWTDLGGIAIAHRRLSILDLACRADQPMLSGDDRYVIAFNGEIYNFRDLRAELASSGERFKTSSDTEVLLKMYARHGEKMLPLLRGMFAFAIWDRLSRVLFVARDPYGIKPLYIARTSEGWLVASQVKALLATGVVSREPDAVGQAGFWLLGSVPEPRTWFRDISALPAGHFAYLAGTGETRAPRSYWSVSAVWRDAPVSTESDGEIRERVREALRRSAQAHLVSDVPVGVFLSGGIDSGALVALMSDLGAPDIHGVTIGFREFGGRREDELPVAGQIARLYGVAHHARIVTKDEFIADVPTFVDAMDQPSIDAINTWYVSKAAAEIGLKAVVSGVGGDELFQGYASFRQVPAVVKAWRRASRIPGLTAVARLGAEVKARWTRNSRWRLMTSMAESIEGTWFLRRSIFSPSDLPELMGEQLFSQLSAIEPEELIRDLSGPLAEVPEMAVGQLESTIYLRNQLLRDSDWASMSHSLELRTPLVDAWLLRDLQPCLRKFVKYRHKSLIANAPTHPLIKSVADRRKVGFVTPALQWLCELHPDEFSEPNIRFWARHVARSFDTSCASISADGAAV